MKTIRINLTAPQAQILATFNHWKHCEIVEYPDCITGKLKYDMDYWQTRDEKHCRPVNPRTVGALLKKGMLTRLPDNLLIIVTSQEWEDATAKAKEG